LALCEKYFRVEEKYHQSHSQSYLRHQALLREFESLQKRVRFSKLLSFENRVRKLLGRRSWDGAPLSHKLWQAVPGDFVIEALDTPDNSQLAYILVGAGRQ
jgi:hypothetical protein